MKTLLKYTALFSLAALSTAAAAETAGLNLPDYVNAEAGLSLFAAASALLTFGHDYSRRSGLEAPRRRGGALLPAVEAFAGSRAPVTARRRSRSRRAFKPTVRL